MTIHATPIDLDEATALAETGITLTEAETRLGLARNTLRRRLLRHERTDILDRFGANATDPRPCPDCGRILNGSSALITHARTAHPAARDTPDPTLSPFQREAAALIRRHVTEPDDALEACGLVPYLGNNRADANGGKATKRPAWRSPSEWRRPKNHLTDPA